MSIKIDRFEAKQKNEKIHEVIYKTKTGIVIKDHKSDVIIAYINLDDDVEENKELAGRIITTIETYIEEKENGAENQDG